jgi:hypothetical protein
MHHFALVWDFTKFSITLRKAGLVNELTFLSVCLSILRVSGFDRFGKLRIVSSAVLLRTNQTQSPVKNLAC